MVYEVSDPFVERSSLLCESDFGSTCSTGWSRSLRQNSKKGEIVNEFPDRISDVLIFVGIAHSHSLNLTQVTGTAIGALFTAYIGILSQRGLAPRQFGGLMSKPWRMFCVIIAAIATLAFPGLDAVLQNKYHTSMFSITCWIVVAGCLQTTVYRYRRADMDWLDRQESKQ